MKKNQESDVGKASGVVWKMWLTMKLLFCFLLIGFSTVYGNAFSQVKISISVNEVSLQEVFEKLTEQTGYHFVYSNEMLQRTGKISVDMQNCDLGQIMAVCLKNTGLWYRLEDNIIVISPKFRQPDVPQKKITLTGNVKDKEGRPLPGVTILLKGSAVGVVSDVDGNFTLTVPEESGLTLVFSFVGMKTQEVVLSGQQVLHIVMLEDVSQMEEVIVTGYQEVKKEKMTGAVTTISSEKLSDRYTPNLIQNLEARVAGLSTYGGKPIIRGTGTLYGESAPLLVVDGLPVEGSIEDLNPYDIASVNVLKDAAASAIYGARAANGIIVVTTKNARNKGKIDIDFQANITLYENKNVDYHDNFLMNAEEQVERASEYYDYYFNRKYADDPSMTRDKVIENFGKNITDGAQINPVAYAWYQHAAGNIGRSELDNILADLSKNNFAQDFADNIYRRQVMQQYNLSLRGSSDKFRNNLVINYRTDNMGIIEHKSNWLNVYYKGSCDLAKWLVATFSVNGVYANIKQYGNDYNVNLDPFSYAQYQSFYNADGSVKKLYSWYCGNEYMPLQEGMEDLGFNLVDELRDNQTKTRRQEMRYHGDLLFKIIPGLTAQTQFVYEVNSQNVQQHATQESHAARTIKNAYAKMDTESHKLVYMTPETGGFLQTTHTSGNFWTARGQLNYTNTFRKHEISAIAGLEFRETKTSGDKSLVLGYDEQLQSSATHTVDFGTLSQMSNSPYFQMNGSPFPCNQFAFTPYLENGMGIVKEVRHRYGSGYFNATYTYDNKYNIFGSFRKDYADIYGLDAKFRGRPLWSVGIGWNAHNESFLRDLSWMDFLKLRFSYGVTGNIYQGATSHMTASSGDINSTTNLPVASISSPANPDLRWEQNRTTNVGLDYGFMSYRLRGSLDYYVKTGKDIFAPITLDPTTGFSSMVANVASIRNNGIELAIGYDWFVPGNRRGFSWTTNLTVTYNKNKVLEVENPATRAYDLVSLPYKTGYPVNALWAYRFAGIDDRPGLVGQSMYYVENGNTSHNASSASVDVLEFGGQSDPKAIVGMDNQLRWNGLSLGFLLVYYGGHKMFAQPKSEVFESSWDSPLNIVYLNSWTPENHSDVPGIGEYASTSLGSECRTATNCLYDADFLKIRNITIGYDLPEHLTEKVGISKISLRFQINDPKALWIKNNAGIDPETLGIRKQASYMFGVNLSL